jgi:hypothetical protein
LLSRLIFNASESWKKIYKVLHLRETLIISIPFIILDLLISVILVLIFFAKL